MAHPFQEFIDAVSKHLTELNTHTQAYLDPQLSDRVSDGGRRTVDASARADEAMAAIRASAAGLQAQLSALTVARTDVTDPRAKRPGAEGSVDGYGGTGTAVADAERVDFDRAASGNTAAGWDAFMRKYPNSRFTAQAQTARAKL